MPLAYSPAMALPDPQTALRVAPIMNQLASFHPPVQFSVRPSVHPPHPHTYVACSLCIDYEIPIFPTPCPCAWYAARVFFQPCCTHTYNVPSKPGDSRSLNGQKLPPTTCPSQRTLSMVHKSCIHLPVHTKNVILSCFRPQYYGCCSTLLRVPMLCHRRGSGP